MRKKAEEALKTSEACYVSAEKAGATGIKGFALKPLVRRDITALIRKVLDGERAME